MTDARNDPVDVDAGSALERLRRSRPGGGGLAAAAQTYADDRAAVVAAMAALSLEAAFITDDDAEADRAWARGIRAALEALKDHLGRVRHAASEQPAQAGAGRDGGK